MKASTHPLQDIEKIAYEGQDPKRKLYRAGYESYFERMPTLNEEDPKLQEKVKKSNLNMERLGLKLIGENWVNFEDMPGPMEFIRTIIGLEAPIAMEDGTFQEGAEFVVAKWGDGHTSPVHGHSAGYIHESILMGRMRVNSYRLTDPSNRIVRPVETTIASRGTFASLWAERGKFFKREALIHNFTSIGTSVSLHYLPEHTRDGRDNGFNVEYYDDTHIPQVKQISSREGLYLPNGEVVLVRSLNVPEYGDHYIVITGRPIVKDHGLRPQEIAIGAKKTILDQYPMLNGTTLLQLLPESRDEFLKFHNLK